MRIVLFFVFAAALLTMPAHAFRDLEMQQRYCAGMPINVDLPDRTEVDCLDGDLAIEVDFSDQWATAIGQSLHYSRVQTERLQALVTARSQFKPDSRPASIIVCNEDSALDLCRRHLDRMIKTLEFHRIGMIVWFCDSRTDMHLSDCEFRDLYQDGEFK